LLQYIEIVEIRLFTYHSVLFDYHILYEHLYLSLDDTQNNSCVRISEGCFIFDFASLP